jgi:excisionase family DNA binding protein
MVIAESLVYTIEEAAELLKIGRSGAYEAARRGNIPVLRIGRRWLVPRVALDKMLADAGKDAEVAG